MTNRSLLTIIVATMSLGWLTLVSVPFGRALSQPGPLPKPTFEIPIQNIQPGSGELIILEKSQRIETKQFLRFKTGHGFLILRDTKKDYNLYWVPIWEDKILMPHRAWGQHEGACKNLKFGKTIFSENTVYCENTEWPEFLTKQWYWSFDGTNFGEDLPDLTPVKFRIVSGVMHAYWQ